MKTNFQNISRKNFQFFLAMITFSISTIKIELLIGKILFNLSDNLVRLREYLSKRRATLFNSPLNFFVNSFKCKLAKKKKKKKVEELQLNQDDNESVNTVCK
jgi:hypothetical protein